MVCPDRIRRALSSPYETFHVQLNKGSKPDLLDTIDNGIGGIVSVIYKPATQYDNTDDAGISLLSSPLITVQSVTVDDGMGNTSTTTYDYAGGMWDHNLREFRGFNCVEVIDPLGSKKLTYFHQGGGRDCTADGEFQDAGSIAKKGIPYCTEIYGSDGLLYTKTINKVDEVELHTNGWCFPFIAQTIMMEYDGLANYRATAKQFEFDATAFDTNSSGNMTKLSDLGEVANVNITSHAFTDIASDAFYTHFTYATLTNADIINKPANVKATSDATGNIKLRDTLFGYDGRGNQTTESVWLDTTDTYFIKSFDYDQYGNLITKIKPRRVDRNHDLRCSIPNISRYRNPGLISDYQKPLMSDQDWC